ncbi:MAG: methyl-accepting chemotaxis protein [Rubricella sp.]
MLTALTVPKRLALGFSVAILAMVLVAAFTSIRFSEAERRFVDYLTLKEEMVWFTELQEDFLETVVAVNQFSLSGDSRYSLIATEELDGLAEQILAAREADSVRDEFYRLISDIDGQLVTYREQFERYVALEQRESGMVAELQVARAAIVDGGAEIAAAGNGAGSMLLAGAADRAQRLLGAADEAVGVFTVDRGATTLERAVIAIGSADAHLRTTLETIEGGTMPGAEDSLRDVVALGRRARADLETIVTQMNEIADFHAQAVSILGQLTGPTQDRLNTTFDVVVDERIERLEEEGDAGASEAASSRIQVAVFAAVAAIITIVAGLRIGGSVVRPLAKLNAAIAGIANDDPQVELPDERKDEFGTIGKNVGLLDRRRSEARRIRDALDSSTAMVMIADSDHNITFLSSALEGLLSEAEDEIRKSLRDFRAEKVLGANIDIFHSDPSHQRKMLAALTDKHETRITLGERIFSLMISPLRLRDGTETGHVVEWVDRTDEMRIQGEIDSVIARAVDGEFDGRVSPDSKQDSLNRIAENVNRLVQTVESGIAATQSAIESLAAGDLTRRMDGQFKGAFATLQTNVNGTVARLAELVSDIQITAHEVNQAIADIADEAKSLSRRTEAQAASLEETAATMEEMSSTIKNNAESAQTATDLSDNAANQAQEGGAIVRDAIQAMSLIEEGSEKMSQIISAIDSIAFQTNLLALNAAVEAARAGDAGKGFAVVASEVRTLAQRSGEAAKDIKTLIASSTSHVSDGVSLVRRTGGSLDEIIESIAQVNRAIGEITAMSREQATGVDEISSALSEMDGMTQQNASMSEQSASRAAQLQIKAEALAELVRQFRTGAATPKPARAPKRTDSSPVPDHRTAQPATGSAAVAVQDDDWAEF